MSYARFVGRLANATLEGFTNVDTKIAALVDSQIRPDESVRNLTAVVGYFSQGRT